MEVFYNPMKEIDQLRDLEVLKNHLMYFDARTKFIRSL